LARVYLEHVWKKFGTVVAVKDLTLEVKDGEFFVLLGPVVVEKLPRSE